MLQGMIWVWWPYRSHNSGFGIHQGGMLCFKGWSESDGLIDHIAQVFGIVLFSVFSWVCQNIQNLNNFFLNLPKNRLEKLLE